jgi:hypothetical protein
MVSGSSVASPFPLDCMAEVGVVGELEDRQLDSRATKERKEALLIEDAILLCLSASFFFAASMNASKSS